MESQTETEILAELRAIRVLLETFIAGVTQAMTGNPLMRLMSRQRASVSNGDTDS